MSEDTGTKRLKALHRVLSDEVKGNALRAIIDALDAGYEVGKMGEHIILTPPKGASL